LETVVVALLVVVGLAYLFRVLWQTSSRLVEEREVEKAARQRHYGEVRKAIATLPRPVEDTTAALLGDLSSTHQRLLEWCADTRAEGLYQMDIAGKPIVVVHDPATVRRILLHRPVTWIRPQDQRRVVTEMGVLFLIVTEGEEWRRVRNVVSRPFNMPSVRSMFPGIVQVCDRMEKRWRHLIAASRTGSIVVNFKREIANVSMEVILSTAFGKQAALLDEDTADTDAARRDKRMVDLFLQVIQILWYRVMNDSHNPTWRLAPTEKDRHDNAVLKESIQFTEEIIAECEAKMAKGIKVPPCLLTDMINASGAESPRRRLSPFELMSNTLGFVLAGYETTSSSVAWGCFELGKTSGLRSLHLLREVVDDNFTDGAELTLATVESELVLLEAALQESLRMHPVSPMMAHETNKPGLEVAPGVPVPEGTEVWCMLTALSKNEAFFSKPEEFRPERFVKALREEAPDLAVHNEEPFLPFGAGSRICPGMRLAKLEAAVIFAYILRSFKFELATDEDQVKEIMQLVVVPNSLPMKLSLR